MFVYGADKFVLLAMVPGSMIATLHESLMSRHTRRMLSLKHQARVLIGALCIVLEVAEFRPCAMSPRA